MKRQKSDSSDDFEDLELRNYLRSVTTETITSDHIKDEHVFKGDVEDNESSSGSIFLPCTTFPICINCKEQNDSPEFTTCKKCFQDRKKTYPIRSKKHRVHTRIPSTQTKRGS
ncbi:hypothetical protein ABEB36_015797 [Hypothenemus hampei]|uniref:Uncharacterized protein n=1 Tax=Hypothenemus hampei TaxID=57062 RepID=A0ABD1DYQ1_HYPHA